MFTVSKKIKILDEISFDISICETEALTLKKTSVLEDKRICFTFSHVRAKQFFKPHREVIYF